MEFIRKHFWTVVLLICAAIPLVGLMIYASLAQTRSATDLAVADRCMDWSHESQYMQLADDPELAEKCNLYFRVRSTENAGEDIRRWERRAAHGTKSSSPTD
jgi:hypothetical protein